MGRRSARAQVGRETLEILERGFYKAPSGREVTVVPELEKARAGSILYTPDHLNELTADREWASNEAIPAASAEFAVVNKTTLRAARELLEIDANARVLALNFASARHPGGGFLGGSEAQEESLARASGLYACIAPHRIMYEENQRTRSCLYTDHMIYSPDVPVFRDDRDVLLEEPYLISFLTAPAVNAGAVRKNEPDRVGMINDVMFSRMGKMLSVAHRHGHECLVLGAWGCGVFQNDPERIADGFARHLLESERFRGVFRRVVFAVLDWSESGVFIGPFARRFAALRPR